MSTKRTQPNIYYNENGELDVTRIVMVTIIKTCYQILIVCTMVIVLIFGMFPLTGMRFFRTVGLKDRALDMANMYVARTAGGDNSAFSGHVDGLVYKMMLAEELFLEKATTKYLDDIYDATYSYALIEDIEQRNRIIDSNNLKAFSPIAHANVYSFADRVCNLNYFASLRLGNPQWFLIGNQRLELEEIMSSLQAVTSEHFAKDDQLDGISQEEAKFGIFFGQLTEYVAFEIGANSQSAMNLLTKDDYKLFDLLLEKLPIFRDYALSYYTPASIESDSTINIDAMREQLYLVRCVGRLYSNMHSAAQFLGRDIDRWDQERRLPQDSNVTIMDHLISYLLPQYILAFEENQKSMDNLDDNNGSEDNEDSEQSGSEDNQSENQDG